MIARTGTSDIIFLYNGRDGVITDDNGLYYMRARYYSPAMRRFINADIVAGSISNAITLNRFAYANGNPVSNVDPFGLAVDERGEINYTVTRRSDINGIGLLKTGEILAGNNVKDSDIEILIKIAKMTNAGKTDTEILKVVNDYVVRMKKDTVIKENKLLDYYTAFQDITTDLLSYILREEYTTIMHYTFNPRIGDMTERSIMYLVEFYNSVRNGAKWDLKQKSEWQQSSLYYFNDELVDSDAPGNIMFGYMGKVYGIPDFVLHFGAGFAQVSAGTSSLKWFSTLGDDPIDNHNVDRGIDLYNKLRY